MLNIFIQGIIIGHILFDVYINFWFDITCLYEDSNRYGFLAYV